MIKLECNQPRQTAMREMAPLEAGVVVTPGPYLAHIVLRTASERKFEVISLTDPGVWWGDSVDLEVRTLGKEYTLKIS